LATNGACTRALLDRARKAFACPPQLAAAAARLLARPPAAPATMALHFMSAALLFAGLSGVDAGRPAPDMTSISTTAGFPLADQAPPSAASAMATADELAAGRRALLAAGSAAGAPLRLAPVSGFVSRTNSSFRLDGAPYVVTGANQCA
jgi:hypothetical protein